MSLISSSSSDDEASSSSDTEWQEEAPGRTDLSWTFFAFIYSAEGDDWMDKDTERDLAEGWESIFESSCWLSFVFFRSRSISAAGWDPEEECSKSFSEFSRNCLNVISLP